MADTAARCIRLPGCVTHAISVMLSTYSKVSFSCLTAIAVCRFGALSKAVAPSAASTIAATPGRTAHLATAVPMPVPPTSAPRSALAGATNDEDLVEHPAAPSRQLHGSRRGTQSATRASMDETSPALAHPSLRRLPRVYPTDAAGER